tara:strand:- start:52726 stop:53067 length:342 start_codon:yes stop_codon:yes gene_type:complete
MLILTPSEPIYFLIRSGQYGQPVANITCTISEDDAVMIRISDSKEVSQHVSLKAGCTHKAAKVHIHDSDANYIAYISWFAIDNKIGIDTDSKNVMILREKLMIGCNFKPLWSR